MVWCTTFAGDCGYAYTELNVQRTNYIECVTEEDLIGNLEAIKHKLGRNWLTDERREERF